MAFRRYAYYYVRSWRSVLVWKFDSFGVDVRHAGRPSFLMSWQDGWIKCHWHDTGETLARHWPGTGMALQEWPSWWGISSHNHVMNPGPCIILVTVQVPAVLVTHQQQE
jgi:hypothetical protein